MDEQDVITMIGVDVKRFWNDYLRRIHVRMIWRIIEDFSQSLHCIGCKKISSGATPWKTASVKRLLSSEHASKAHRNKWMEWRSLCKSTFDNVNDFPSRDVKPWKPAWKSIMGKTYKPV
jgi:hypothetical protein